MNKNTYKRKPVNIEAVKFSRNNLNDSFDFAGDMLEYDPEARKYFLITLEGKIYITEGDYIIRGVDGEYYPCKEQVFHKIYDKVGIQESDEDTYSIDLYMNVHMNCKNTLDKDKATKYEDTLGVKPIYLKD